MNTITSINMRFLIILLIIPFLSFGQDTLKVKRDSIERRGVIILAGIVNNPNVGNKQTILKGDLLNYLKYKRTDYTIEGNYLLSYSNNKKIQEDGSLLLQPRLFYEDWNSFTFLQFIKSYARKLDIRYEAAIGGGRSLYKSKPLNISASYAVLYDYSVYNNDSVTTKYLRHSFKTKFFGNFERIGYYVEFYFQPRMDDWSSYNHRAKVNLDCFITKRLSVTVNYVDTYETFIVYGNHLVSSLTFGVKINY